MTMTEKLIDSRQCNAVPPANGIAASALLDSELDALETACAGCDAVDCCTRLDPAGSAARETYKHRMDRALDIGLTLFARTCTVAHLPEAARGVARDELALVMRGVEALHGAETHAPVPMELGEGFLAESFAALTSFATRYDLLDATELAEIFAINRALGHPWANQTDPA